MLCRGCSTPNHKRHPFRTIVRDTLYEAAVMKYFHCSMRLTAIVAGSLAVAGALEAQDLQSMSQNANQWVMTGRTYDLQRYQPTDPDQRHERGASRRRRGPSRPARCAGRKAIRWSSAASCTSALLVPEQGLRAGPGEGRRAADLAVHAGAGCRQSFRSPAATSSIAGSPIHPATATPAGSCTSSSSRAISSPSTPRPGRRSTRSRAPISTRARR